MNLTVATRTTMETTQDTDVTQNTEPRLYERIRELGMEGHALGAWLTKNVGDAPVPLVELAEGLGLGVEIVDDKEHTATLDRETHTVHVSSRSPIFDQRYALAVCIAEAIAQNDAVDAAGKLEACADALLVPPPLLQKYLRLTDNGAQLARVFGVPASVIERRHHDT